MNAFQPLSPPPPPDRSRRTSPRIRHRLRQDPHRAIAIETVAKLGVNVLLGIVAVSTLAKLLPYNISQQAKLRGLKSEVTALNIRVDQLQADLSHHFDPQQAMSVMQEQSFRVDPRQRQVVWLNPETSQARQLNSNSQPEGAEPHSVENTAPTETTPDF